MKAKDGWLKMSGSEAWNFLPSIFSLPASEGGTTENTEYTEWKAGLGTQPSVYSVYSVVVFRGRWKPLI